VSDVRTDLGPLLKVFCFFPTSDLLPLTSEIAGGTPVESDVEERLEMVKDFVTESRELLDTAEPQIIELERTAASGSVDGEILNGVFRLFHSLKGTAAFLDLQNIISVTHEAETLLDIIRKKGADITPSHVDLLCRTSDFIRKVLDRVESHLDDEGFEAEAEFLINDFRNAIAPAPGEATLPEAGDAVSPIAGETALPDSQDRPEQVMGAPTHVPIYHDHSASAEGREQGSGDTSDASWETGSLEVGRQRGVAAATGQEAAAATELDESLNGMGLLLTPEMSRRFAEESLELCEETEMALLGLEKAVDDEIASQAFRAFHSIKGNAGFFGYGDIERLSHLAENVLDGIRERMLPCDDATMSALLCALDAIRNKLIVVTGGANPEIPNFQQLCDILQKIVEFPEGEDEHIVQPRPGDTHPVDGSGARLEYLAEPPEPEREAEPGEESTAASLLTPPAHAVAGLPEAGPGQESTAASQPPQAPSESRTSNTIEIGGIGEANPNKSLTSSIEPRTSDMPELGHPSGPQEMEPEHTAVQAPVPEGAETGGIGTAPALIERRANKNRTATAIAGTRLEPRTSTMPPGSMQQVIRVDIDKLDKLLDLVGELVIAEAMVTNDPKAGVLQHDRTGKAFLQLDKISREIQEVAMSMRMIPLSGVFRRMLRLVRDLANKANKQVELEIIGEETEVDKTIIEQISDPLVHLIRNAVDHGIESAAVRRQVGKPETGKVTLAAKHSAGEVWITVEDDGGGLDREKIFRKGLEKGLVREEDRDLKDEHIWRLIFEPGFSTAEKVSNISGRGVGMDVVKQNIEKLRGKIDIRSKPGVGTMFAIRIPLTLAIIEGMVVRVGANRYIIPISSIRESFRPRADQITCTPDRLEIVRIRGELLPIARLHQVYHVQPLYEDLTKGILIYVDSNDSKCCLFVDELIGQQQIVIKGLPAYLKRIRGISGCAIMGDGEVGMILDIADLVSSLERIA
jgi:two-component system chemotaxis sensor kinase CheA